LPTQTGKKLKLDADMMKVAKMPVLAIEILSPNQTINELLRRIEALFALGIKSCWLVIPALEEIRVYGQDFAYKTFDTQRVQICCNFGCSRKISSNLSCTASQSTGWHFN
jgi:hypothetical protein